MCHVSQSLTCDRDLRGLFLETVVQYLVKLAVENFNSALASQEDGPVVLPGTTASPDSHSTIGYVIVLQYVGS